MTNKTILEIAEETAKAVKRIEDVTGKSVRSFRHYPTLDNPEIINVHIVFEPRHPTLEPERTVPCNQDIQVYLIRTLV